MPYICILSASILLMLSHTAIGQSNVDMSSSGIQVETMRTDVRNNLRALNTKTIQLKSELSAHEADTNNRLSTTQRRFNDVQSNYNTSQSGAATAQSRIGTAQVALAKLLEQRRKMEACAKQNKVLVGNACQAVEVKRQ